jgi:hypothetical protein
MKSYIHKKINISLIHNLLAALLMFFLISAPGSEAAGTAATGKMIVRVTKFESSGYIKSYEGILEYAGYDDDEDCNEKENFCYKPSLETMEFSVHEDNKQIAYFINQNVGKEMLIEYKKHRVEAVGLATRFEVVGVSGRKESIPKDLPQRLFIKKTGSKRNFALYGNVLKLERTGSTYKSWEGVYYDRQRDVVHPFSLSDDGMAEQIMKMMEIAKDYHFGVSQARAVVGRATTYDIFEVNYTKKPDTL